MIVLGGILMISAGPAAAQDGKQVSGKYRLTVGGREAGTEEFRLEEFEDGKVVLFAKAKFDLELSGSRRAYFTDTVLTMDRAFAPVLYAGYRKAGREEDRIRIEWDKGVAVTPKRRIRTTAAYLLDTTTVSHLLPILRSQDPGKRRLKLFNPTALGDFDGAVEDRGWVLLRGKEASVRVHEIQLDFGDVSYTAHLDDRQRMLRVWSAVNNTLGELEGYEGWVPEAIAPEGIEEADVVFQSGSLRLSGTVARPRGERPCPALVLIADTGPRDRQGNLVRGRGGSEEFAGPAANASLLRAVAQSLAGAGFLVLRYDVRGCGASQGDFSTARFTDLVSDAAAGMSYLRGRADAVPAGFVGHGEGALAASLLAAEDASVRTVALLAPPPSPLGEIALARQARLLREQGTREEILREMLAQQRRLFERIKSSPEDYLEIDERRTFVGWMRQRLSIDPRETLSKVRSAVLVCGGSGDPDLPPDQAAALGRLRPGTECRVFQGLDHAFAGPDGRVDGTFLKVLAERILQTLK